MESIPLVDEVEALAGRLPALLAARRSELAGLLDAMAALESAGLIYASEHWRAGRYLYLIHPSHDGQRVRKYIGADPVKIAEAKAGIRRAAEYDELAGKAIEAERVLRQGGDRLRVAVSCLAGDRSW